MDEQQEEHSGGTMEAIAMVDLQDSTGEPLGQAVPVESWLVGEQPKITSL